MTLREIELIERDARSRWRFLWRGRKDVLNLCAHARIMLATEQELKTTFHLTAAELEDTKKHRDDLRAKAENRLEANNKLFDFIKRTRQFDNKNGLKKLT